MYSTSSTRRRASPGPRGSYNVAFDSEIGHFQFCSGPKKIPATPFGLLPNGNPTTCPKGNSEGRGVNKQPADGDDLFCFPGKEALVFKVTGCTFTNTGFDGASYQRLWPNGNTKMHPTPFQFTSPTTGPFYTKQYSQVGFEADLPDIEQPICNRSTGVGCTLIPQTDTGLPAVFYPFYSTTKIKAALAATGSSATTSPERSATSGRTASTARCSSSPTPRRAVRRWSATTISATSSPTRARRDSTVQLRALRRR